MAQNKGKASLTCEAMVWLCRNCVEVKKQSDQFPQCNLIMPFCGGKKQKNKTPQTLHNYNQSQLLHQTINNFDQHVFWRNTSTNKEEKTLRLFPHWVFTDGSVLQKIFNNTIFSLLTFVKVFQLLSDGYETHNKSSYKIKYIENRPICLLWQVFSCFGAQWASVLASLANSLGKHP